MNNILGKVNVGVSKLVGTCLISFFRCQSQHNGVTATEAQRRMPTPRRMPRLPRRVLSPRSLPPPPHVANAPLAAAMLASRAARVAEDHDGNHQERTKLCRPGNAVTSTHRARHAATNAAAYATATDRRLLPSTAATRRHRRGASGFARVSGNFAERWFWGARG